jgi:hypothetical protein
MKKLSTPAALSAALIYTLVTGCIEDGNTTGSPARGMAVKFSTSISKTRAYGNLWEPGDRIGVWMLPAGSDDWSDPETAPIGSNMLYGHGSETDSLQVVFSGIGDENILVWPDEGNVDFVAYYPYLAEGIEGSLYPIDLSGQDPQNKIDLMYSDNAKNLGVSSGNPALSFEHKLAKLVFNVEDAGGASLEGMRATFEGLPATALFDLATGEMVESEEGGAEPFDAVLTSTFDADEDDDGVKETAIVEAIVLPGTDLDYTLTFALSNDERAVFTPKDALVAYEAGKRYIYNISFMRDSVRVVFEDAEGELKSIVDWTDVKDENPYELPKDKDPEEGDPFAGERGEPFDSGTLSETSGRYDLISTGTVTKNESGMSLRKDSRLVISMDTFEGGVASVNLTMKNILACRGDLSVKVGSTPFTCNYGGSPLESVPLHGIGTGDDSDFTFNSSDGKLFSGEIEIVISCAADAILVNSFRVN